MNATNNSTMTLMDILLAADQHATTQNGVVVLYYGDATDRNLALDLFGKINATGGI